MLRVMRNHRMRWLGASIVVGAMAKIFTTPARVVVAHVFDPVARWLLRLHVSPDNRLVQSVYIRLLCRSQTSLSRL